MLHTRSASQTERRKAEIRRIFRGGFAEVVRRQAVQLDEATRLGAYYVIDAFAGRLEHGMAKMSQQPPVVFLAFQLQTSDAWLGFVLLCSVVHSLLVFVEDHNGRAFELSGDGASPWMPRPPSPCRLFELSLIMVYATDVTLKAAYMGWAEYFSKPWQKLFAIVICILLIDAATLSPVRLTRPLRPAVLCLRARSVRRFFTVLRQMVPGFLRVCMPLVFFLLLSSSFGAMAFGQADDRDDPLRTPSSAGYNLWILTVGAENYKELLEGARSSSPLYYTFFFVTLAVGHIFLLGLLLGITFDVFIAHTKAQVKSERLKELKGLTKAFAVMDAGATGKLGMVVWDNFLKHLMPRSTPQERILYFEIGSGFANEIDAIAFLDLRQVLDYRFVNSDQLRPKAQLGAPGSVRARLAAAAADLRAAKWLQRVMVTIVTVDCALLPWGAPADGGSSSASLPLRLVAALCSVVLWLEMLLGLVAAGSHAMAWRWFSRLSAHERVAASAVTLHFVASVALLGPFQRAFCGGATACLSLRRGALEKAAYTLRLLRCWRLVTLNATLHKYVATFFHILPAFLQTLSFALIIAYFFAVSATDVFGGSVERFSSPGAALLTMIQLFFGVDFKQTVEDTVNQAGDFALLFFMVYHILGVLIVFNLINAIIIQFYSETLNERAMQREDEQRKVDAALQDALLDHVRKQKVLDLLWGKKTTQGVADLNMVRRPQNVTGRELRRVLGVGSQVEGLSDDELRKCQKYAKVDLVAAHKERREGDRSLTDFERNFYQQVKASPPAAPRCFAAGEVIFEAGRPHKACYFVQGGRVVLVDRDGAKVYKEDGQMFGELSLLGEVSQPVTARALTDCDCLVVTREAFEERYNDVNTMGHLAIRIRRARSLDSAAPEGERGEAYNSESGGGSAIHNGEGNGGDSSSNGGGHANGFRGGGSSGGALAVPAGGGSNGAKLNGGSAGWGDAPAVSWDCHGEEEEETSRSKPVPAWSPGKGGGRRRKR